jgi:hypothetical protein
MPSEILADLPTTIPFVPDDSRGASLGPTRPNSLHGSTGHQLVKHTGFVPLARGQEEGHELATTFRAHMHFGTESTPAPADRFYLGVPFFAPAAC